jgi:hypothetical protein
VNERYNRAVTTYKVTRELVGSSTKRLVLFGIFSGAIYIAGSVLVGLRWPNPGQGFGDQIAESVIAGILFSLGMSFFAWLQSDFAIELSQDFITVRRVFSTRTIRKGEVRSVNETRPRLLATPGLRISKYSSFGTWLWGGIWIPKSLPEYEQIRSLALSWMQSVG